MKMKCTLAFIFIFSIASAQTFEEQRKVLFDEWTPELAQLLTVLPSKNGGGLVGGFTIYPHSDYTYYDLYLDTDDLLLFRKGLSLRLRKRVISPTETAYGMQLKSEMLTPSQPRIEIDETELGYYKFKGKNVASFLDALLERTEQLTQGFQLESEIRNDAQIQALVKTLSDWLQFKWMGASEPLQELRHILKDSMKQSKIEKLTFRPVLVGRSVRNRSHILVDRANTTTTLANLADSQLSSSQIPTTLPTLATIVWTAEGSMDGATFYATSTPSVNGTQAQVRHTIREFEIENKYQPRENGTTLLDALETEFLSSFATHSELSSKYRQSAKAIFGLAGD